MLFMNSSFGIQSQTVEEFHFTGTAHFHHMLAVRLGQNTLGLNALFTYPQVAFSFLRCLITWN